MNVRFAKFGGGALPRNGSNVEVCPDRFDSSSDAPTIAMGRPQTRDPLVPRVSGSGKSVNSGSSIQLTSLLTPREAAGFLGIPESTLAQWRSQRRGPPYIKLELRLVRYRRADLEGWLARQTVETEVDKASA